MIQKKPPSLPQVLAERPAASWEEDVAWIHKQLAGQTVLDAGMMGALIRRHPQPDDIMGNQVVEWMAGEDTRERLGEQYLIDILARIALRGQCFTWLDWAITRSPQPEAALEKLGTEEREFLPFSQPLEDLSPEQGAAWNALWWNLAEQSPTWSKGKYYSFFGLGLHHAWGQVEVDLSRLAGILRSVEESAAALADWPQSVDYELTINDMKRRLLGEHIQVDGERKHSTPTRAL